MPRAHLRVRAKGRVAERAGGVEAAAALLDRNRQPDTPGSFRVSPEGGHGGDRQQYRELPVKTDAGYLVGDGVGGEEWCADVDRTVGNPRIVRMDGFV